MFPNKLTYIYHDVDTVTIASSNDKIFGSIKLKTNVPETRKKNVVESFLVVVNIFFNINSISDMLDVVEDIEIYFSCIIDDVKKKNTENTKCKVYLHDKKAPAFGDVAVIFETHYFEFHKEMVQSFTGMLAYLTTIIDGKYKKQEIEKIEEYLVLKKNIRKFDSYLFRYLEK